MKTDILKLAGDLQVIQAALKQIETHDWVEYPEIKEVMLTLKKTQNLIIKKMENFHSEKNFEYEKIPQKVKAWQYYKEKEFPPWIVNLFDPKKKDFLFSNHCGKIYADCISTAYAGYKQVFQSDYIVLNEKDEIHIMKMDEFEKQFQKVQKVIT